MITGLHPDNEEGFRKGYLARKANKQRTANPYQDGTEHHAGWQAGWSNRNLVSLAQRERDHLSKRRGQTLVEAGDGL